MAIREDMLERERIANRRKHWVRAVTACNSRCLFCLDMDTPRGVFLPTPEIQGELRRGRDELDADKVIISGGEASLHPDFPDLIAYARSIGYDRVQTVTNGWNFSDRAFYQRCRDAGLGEITFSLHGHTADLHDALTRHPGGFNRLMKGLLRAIRDPRGPIVNVDVVINKQNVGVLDKIVELCASAGVTEFDLLHVIPQAEAFRNRDALFYDVREHMDVLHKVFRLNRHPRFVIWTNRFPVSYLEGMEDLIQDPHKMLDEVNGRRFQVRQYLDAGQPLDCRQPERCKHCFIEPFCTTMDRLVERQNAAGFSVWQIADPAEIPALPSPLPYGCGAVGLALPRWADALPALAALPEGVSLEITGMEAAPPPADLPSPLRLIAESAAQLAAWLSLAPLPSPLSIEIRLTRETAAWMLENRAAVEGNLPALRVHQPSYETLHEAAERDVRDPAAFFSALRLPISVSGLPACLAPGARLAEPLHRLHPTLFDPQTGRIAIHPLSRRHVESGYLARSERCRDCRVSAWCDGAHINLIRDQGLRLLRPLAAGEPWAEDALQQLQARNADPPRRIADGLPLQPPAPSLPGFPPPAPPPPDPLAVIAQNLEARRAARRAAREAMLAQAARDAGEG